MWTPYQSSGQLLGSFFVVVPNSTKDNGPGTEVKEKTRRDSGRENSMLHEDRLLGLHLPCALHYSNSTAERAIWL